MLLQIENKQKQKFFVNSLNVRKEIDYFQSVQFKNINTILQLYKYQNKSLNIPYRYITQMYIDYSNKKQNI